MPNLFTKSQVFSFLASFFITFFLGLCVWSAFLYPDNIFGNIARQVHSIFFRASASGSLELKDFSPAKSEKQNEQNMEQNENEDNFIIGDENLGEYAGTGGIDPSLMLEQDLLDDIAERIDIIQQQIQEITKENQDIEDEQKIEEEPEEDLEENKEEPEEDAQTEEDNLEAEIRPSYSKILISEVQIGTEGDRKQEFIELYNPNDIEISLTDWYLRKKTKTGSDYSSFASGALFSGKNIFSKSYFLICREGYYSNGLCDIFTGQALSDDNSLALKNPNGEISDKLGFGEASDYELSPAQNPENGKTIGRKAISYRVEQDTDDNSADFEIQAPTPRAENITYVQLIAPVASASSGGGSPAPVIYPKILISESQIAPIGQRFFELYNPNDFDVDLTGWYIQRKTKTGDSWASFVSSTKFEGKTVSAKSYFLIASLDLNPDIDLDLTISDDNSFVLKDPSRDISDKLGFGLAQDFELNPVESPEENKSIGRKFLESRTEQDTDDNLSDFEIQEPTPRAENIKWQEPIAEEPPPVEETDITPPSVNFTLESAQNSLNFSINFTMEDILGVVTPSGIDSYIFRWQEEGGSWQEDSPVKVNEGPSFVNLIREFTEGQDEKTYYFQIKAKDTAGNESLWLPETPVSTKISIPKKVLINEIQIDSIDGDGGTDDDWVELYNPNDFDVDLSQWSIQRSPESGTIYKKNFGVGQKISAKEYFLIVRNDAKQELLDIADMACSALQLSDNNTVYLVKNQEEIADSNDLDIVDKVGFGITAFSSETSPALTPPDGKSIVRKELGQDTDDNSHDFIISDTPTPKADNF